MGKFFGTDGIRQSAEKFTPNFIQKIVAGLLNYAEENREAKEGAIKVLVGGDTRESTEWMIRDFEKALEGAGAEHRTIGVFPTPGINYVFYEMGFDFAIDITASHNPYQDNGVKIFERGDRWGLKKGVKLSSDGVQKIEERLGVDQVGEMATVNWEEDISLEAKERYLAHLEEYVESIRPIGAKSVRKVDLSNLKIGMDFANGAMSKIGAELFEKLGAKIEKIHSDERFGQKINTGCGSTSLGSLKQLVQNENLDFGVAFDGDGDRCLLVAQDGEEIDGDQIIALTANYLGLKSVVSTVMVNQGLLTWANKQGVEVEITDVGDQNVAARMREKGILLGGEQSGHVILPNETMGDGMLTALVVCKILSEVKRDNREIREMFLQKTPQTLGALEITTEEKLKFKQMGAKVKEFLTKWTERLEAENERLLARASGTQNVIRVSVWGEDLQKITDETDQIMKQLKLILKD